MTNTKTHFDVLCCLFWFRYNGVLPSGDKGRRKSKFTLYKKVTANGVKPVKHHLVKNPQQSEVMTRDAQTERQESPAIADKPTRHKSLPKLLQFDVPTTLSLLHPKSAKSREIHCKFKLMEFKVIQGHRYWCQSKAHMWLANSNFSRICYRFRDIHG